MAKPNKKGPTKTVDIFCSSCRAPLFKYRKGGKGALVKCFIEALAKIILSSLVFAQNANAHLRGLQLLKAQLHIK